MEKQIFIPNILQSEALKEIDKTILKNEKAFLIVMPPGTGKTYLAAQWFKLQLKKNPKARLLFICHNQDILFQANDKEFANCLSEFDIPRGYYNRSEKNIGQVTFATVQTLRQNLNKLASDYFDYIIVDEAHHYRANSFERVIKHFSPKVLLGLTATPYRMDGKSLLDIFNKTIYNASISEGIKNGLLSKIKYYFVDNDIDFSEIKHDGHGRYDKKSLNKKLCIKEYDDAIIKEYTDIVRQKYGKKKTICFCATVEHVYRMEKLFNDNGIKAIALAAKHYGREGKEVTVHISRRKQIINMFKNGDYDIIFVRDLFNEGMDIPDADSIMLLRPTESSRIFTQQIGRGLRTSKEKNYLLVLDFTGNCYRCDINYEILNEIMELDIEKDVKDKIRGNNDSSEIIIKNIGCEVRLSKKKIDVIKGEKTIIKEKLIEHYFNLKNELGRQPTIRDINKSNISFDRYKHSFHTWKNFLNTINENITKEKLIEHYFNLKKELGRQPTIRDINKSNISIHKYKYVFGSWKNFLNIINENLTKEKLIEHYFNLKNELGRQPTIRDIKKGNIPFYKYKQLFGSWPNFLNVINEECTYDTSKSTEKELIDNYFDVKEKLGRQPKGSEMVRPISLFNQSKYKKHFGSWSNFLRKVNEVRLRRSIPEEELIDNYLNVKKKLNRVPMFSEMKLYGKFSPSTYEYRFGSWHKFLFKMGERKSDDRNKISDEDLIKNYWNLKSKYPNLTTGMVSKKYGSLFNLTTYYKRFGSWRKFLKIANEKSNIDKNCKKNITIISNYTTKNPLPNLNFEKSNKKFRAINTGTLSGYKYTGSAEKDNIRYKIIEKIRDMDTVLILESPDLSSLKEIERQGKNPKKIIIPNHFEFDELATALKDYDTNLNIEVINTSVLQYLADHPDEYFNFLWLDYCGAFSYYRRDLDIMFQREIRDMKLILTYNVFDPKKRDDSYYFTNVISYILKKLRGKNEILLMEDISQRYKKLMFSIGFDIKILQK